MLHYASIPFVALSICLAACALPACAPAAPPPSAPSPLLGKTVPDFKRRTIDGKTADTKKARGRVLVLKFFATYCKPCKKTLPAVEKLHQQLPDVAFIGISEDEYRSDAQKLVATYGLSFPVVHDAGNSLSGRYRVSEMPITFVIDARGQVRWVGTSKQSEAGLRRAIEAARRPPALKPAAAP